jgi:hypothetical protein
LATHEYLTQHIPIMFFVAEATGTNEDEPRCEGYKERDTNGVCFTLEVTEITIMMQFM